MCDLQYTHVCPPWPISRASRWLIVSSRASRPGQSVLARRSDRPSPSRAIGRPAASGRATAARRPGTSMRTSDPLSMAGSIGRARHHHELVRRLPGWTPREVDAAACACRSAPEESVTSSQGRARGRPRSGPPRRRRAPPCTSTAAPLACRPRRAAAPRRTPPSAPPRAPDPPPAPRPPRPAGAAPARDRDRRCCLSSSVVRFPDARVYNQSRRRPAGKGPPLAPHFRREDLPSAVQPRADRADRASRRRRRVLVGQLLQIAQDDRLAIRHRQTAPSASPQRLDLLRRGRCASAGSARTPGSAPASGIGSCRRAASRRRAWFLAMPEQPGDDAGSSRRVAAAPRGSPSGRRPARRLPPSPARPSCAARSGRRPAAAADRAPRTPRGPPRPRPRSVPRPTGSSLPGLTPAVDIQLEGGKVPDATHCRSCTSSRIARSALSPACHRKALQSGRLRIRGRRAFGSRLRVGGYRLRGRPRSSSTRSSSRQSDFTLTRRSR